MSEFIKYLSEICKDDVSTAGGKGANLGELTGKGFPVPPGFVVSAKACEEFFQTIKLSEKLNSLKETPRDALEKCCSAIQGKIERAEFPGKLGQAILAAQAKMVESRNSRIVYAVRSSATAEDLGEASFAGQHGTYYYVDEKNLLKMIKCCWLSLWSPEAVSYRSSQGIDHASVFMAVVVQEMIMSEVSGITFTANPVTASLDEIIIESSWGMGAAIVDGRVSPDHYILERKGLMLREKRIAEKRFLVPPRPKGKTRLEEVPYEKRLRETLSPDLVKTVAEWAIKSEEHFKKPQDVEWAIAGGQFYMLQSRTITVMGREEIGKDIKGEYILFKPVFENFTEPLTPLTGSLVSRVVPPGFKLIRGWLYMDFKLPRLILPFKITDEELMKLLYLGEFVPVKFSFFKLPFFLPYASLLFLLFSVLLARIRVMPEGFMQNYPKLCRKIEEDPAYNPLDTLLKLWIRPSFFEPVGNLVVLVNILSVRYIFLMGALKKILRRWVPDLRDDAVELLCSGSQGVLSAEMGRGIWALAQEARGNGRVREIFLQQRPENVYAGLVDEPQAKEFVEGLHRFLAKNGHRAIKELEFKSVRWEENPAQVLGMIRNYLIIDSDPVRHEDKKIQARRELEAEIRRKLDKSPLERVLGPRWKLVRFLAARNRHFIKMRENSRFYHVMAFYSVRKKILKIEAQFMEQGKLKCKDDIFYLRHDEIVDIEAGKLGWLDVKERIRERRIEHIRLSKIIPPKTIGIKLTEKPQAQEARTERGKVLRGSCASPGNYEGTAHVILDPSVDAELKPGEILIAPYTDPAWTPLFLTAGAAVVEVGSYLSHAGTVAREYGMPCVVEVSGCTRLIQTGTKIRVSGDLGIVELLSEEGEA
jgi:pyruvate,water dikinase